jgi:diguanylate cyclase (GGDEF)-like protein
MVKARVATAGMIMSAIWFVVHLSGYGGWHAQMSGYRWFAPLLAFVPTWLAFQARRRSTLPGARRFALLIGLGWAVMTAGALFGLALMLRTGDLGYPTASPVTQITDQITLVLVLIALLTVPVRNRFSASRLRVGLDMATVLTAGAVFLWYFVVQPNFQDRAAGSFSPLMIFVQTAGVLVVLFAVARLVMGGAAEVSRRTLKLYVAAGVVDVLIGVLQQTFVGPGQVHFSLAAWALFTGLLSMAGLAQLRSAERATVVAAPPSKPSSLLPYFAVAATFILLVCALAGHGLTAATWSVVGGAMGLTALVIARQVVAMRDNSRLIVQLDESLGALRQAMAREQVLGDLGTTLLTTTEPATVHRLAIDAASALLREVPDARAVVIAVTPDDPDAFLVVTAAGRDAEPAIGGRLPATAVPLDLLMRLSNGEIVAGPGLSGLGVTGFDQEAERPLTLLPLLNGERFFGVLSVSAGEDLPPDLLKSLQALRTQVSLALDSVALTAELTMRAMTDALTGLGNRALLRDRLTGALARAKRTGRPVGALLLDLNGFKSINDTYGHDAGDDLLKVVADRLRLSVRTEDTVGRLGGDEFVVIAEDLHSAQDAIVIAERIVSELNKTVPIKGNLVRTPASIGIALSHADTLSGDDLLRAADVAMYDAKRAGGGRFLLAGAPQPDTAAAPVAAAP